VIGYSLNVHSVYLEEPIVAPRSRRKGDQIRAASRVRILDAARAILAERGFAACRVADVAARAGMTPGNVYWHFDSKEAVLAAILAEGFAARDAMAAALADEYGPARRKLEILVDRTIAFHGEQEAFLRILVGLESRGGRELIGSLGFDLRDLDRRWRSNVRRVLAEARSEGAIVSGDPDALVTLFAALFDGLLVATDGAWQALPPEAVRAAALRLLGHRPAG
jgi:AcrR family transcriptional regulator